MTARRTALTALLAFAALANADEPDRDAIKGIWAVESLTVDGVRAPEDPAAGARLTAFDGKDYVRRQGLTIVEEGSYAVDPSKTPRAIDLVIKKGPDAGKRQLGIYEVEDNTLRVCLAEPGSRKRPRSFDAPGHLLAVGRRFRP